MGTEIKKELHLSHSQVTEFMRCPRKYHLHYRLGLLAEFCPSGLLFGSAIHEAVALYNQKRLEGKETSLDELCGVFQGCWEREALPVRLKAGESDKSFGAKAKKLLEFFLSNTCSVGEPVAVEEPFRLQLSEDLPPVWGVIDLVEVSAKGSLILTDYKTAGTRSEPEPDQLILYRKAVLELDYPGNGEVAARYVVLLKTREPASRLLLQKPAPTDKNFRSPPTSIEAVRTLPLTLIFPTPDFVVQTGYQTTVTRSSVPFFALKSVILSPSLMMNQSCPELPVSMS